MFEDGDSRLIENDRVIYTKIVSPLQSEALMSDFVREISLSK